MKTVGLIINPIAGMGGKVGLKGTDGLDILERAINLGATKEAPKRAITALSKLLPIKDEILFLTASSSMGEDTLEDLGFNYKVIYNTKDNTNSMDTIATAKLFKQMGADLIIFVGGDGTARNIYEGINIDTPAIGVPAGVKIHSPVYGNTPEMSGSLARIYLEEGLPLREEEVVDLDEEAFRDNIVRTSLYGYLLVPYKKEFLQNKKAPTPLTEEATQRAIALDIIDHMENDVFYIIGPGTTTRVIFDELGIEGSLLGVDILKNKKMIKKDLSEKEILETIGDNKAKLIITPTGGQGYLLGRGNQQISSDVLRKIVKENIMIISTNSKILNLFGKPLLIYTGDECLDKELAGYYKVKVGYGMNIMYRVSRG